MLSPDGSGALAYNQGVLAGLDYLLDEARKRSIKVGCGYAHTPGCLPRSV